VSACWEAGRLVVRRQFHRDDLLGRAWVGHVVADDAHGLWVWIATGSPYRDIAAADGRSFRDVPFGEWGRTPKAMPEKRWGGNVLMFHPADDSAYSAWFFFAPDGAFRSWYVNLEEPVSRWDDGELAGVDTIDYDLDVVVQPDRSWHWKDADEFAYHLAYPDVYWVDDPAAVWKEGERVIGLVEAGQFPFDGTRTAFRPDPQWTVPAGMPAGWDRARADSE
jgi:uncharacterized protein DUF402